jgi:RNA recognition motif-containing protein
MNIYVGNIAFNVTEEQLRNEFAAFGEVQSITLMNDKYIGSGQLRGYGYVEMPVRTEAVAAIAGLEGKSLCGRPIGVVEARPLSEKRLLVIQRPQRIRGQTVRDRNKHVNHDAEP